MTSSRADPFSIEVGTSSSSINRIISDDDDDCPSSPGSTHQEGRDLMSAATSDDVAAQLAAAGCQKDHGLFGVAAAAAIASAKKREHVHSFETATSVRKREENRLLQIIRQSIDLLATRVGKQAVVVVATPGKSRNTFKVFGSKPLEDVMKNSRTGIMEEIENALAQQAPPPVQEDPSLYELPPLIINGIPTPVEKMTQAQLRSFIPVMIKYSTGRRPGWDREAARPPWWPKDVPWANVKQDTRSEEEKQVSWTDCLRQIVNNCYKHHGREDLVSAFNEEDEKANSTSSGTTMGAESTQTIINPDGTEIQVDPTNPIFTLPDD